MKYQLASLLVLSFSMGAFADEADLKEARERWLRGNYEEARGIYEDLAKDAKSKDSAALGISRCWQSVGEYDKALEGIDAALKNSPKNADLLARRAELLYLRGKWEDAEKSGDQALAIKKDHFLARWILSQIYRDRGDLKKADAGFRWFVRTYTDRVDNDKDITDPDELLLVGLAGCENARWNKLSDQFEFILKDVYNDAFEKDANFWPAKYQAGILLMEKYNAADGLPALEKALAVNPHAAEIYVGKGQFALQKYDVKSAEEFAEQALKINPRLVEALNLRADIHWMSGNVTKAMRELTRARTVNPRDEATLGRIAACLVLQHNNDEFKKLADEVEKFNPKAGTFYFVIADRLEDRRHYEDAEKYFKQALKLRPALAGPQNSLGLLYMRMGREDEAKKILTEAFETDEFNVRVDNTLKVLSHLEKYETIKTEHFLLRFDPTRDKELATLMAKYLEEIYEKLADQFQYRPKGPFVIEVFNNHPMFSGRVIALPDLHTIGACTGRMVAMVSPRADGMKRFNWARVLRHELVHIFNLEQTHFLIPHWYTEGLAVISEGYPRPPQWNQLLLERVPAGNLLNLDTIDLGFIRPRSQTEWNQAYCQSQLYVQFMSETYGKEKVGELLAAYAEGMDTASAIQKVCKVDKASFEKEYLKYLDKVVSQIQGKRTQKAMTYREAKDAHEKNPADNDVAAKLAELCYVRRDKTAARKLTEEVLARKKGHPLACYVKARLLMDAGEDEQGLKLLEQALADPQVFVPQAADQLGKIYFDAAKFDKAAEIFERAHQVEPFVVKWMVKLVQVYAQNGDKEKHIKVLAELAPTDADDIDVRKQLSRLYQELGKSKEAEKYAREALEIDVLDPESQMALGDALVAQKKYPPAIEAYQIVVRMREREKAIDKADDARLELAQAYRANGQKKEALNEVAKILAHDETNAKARELKVQLEK